MDSENKSPTTEVVKTETAAARVLVLGARVAQETGKPPGEPPDGAGSLESDELESENKLSTSPIAKTEIAAAGDLVLGAREAQETGESQGEPPGEPPGGAGSLESVEFESEEKSAISQFVKAETVAAMDLVLGAGEVQETGEPPGELGEDKAGQELTCGPPGGGARRASGRAFRRRRVFGVGRVGVRGQVGDLPDR